MAVQTCRAKFMTYTKLPHLNVKTRHIANETSMDSMPKRLSNTDTSEEFANTGVFLLFLCY